MKPWPDDIPPLPAALPRDRPVALLLRHGERPPIAPGETGADLPLTPHGRAQAQALGRLLGPRLQRVHTSPVRRCYETAAALCDGAGLSLPIVADRRLGDPGIFVLDPELAWDNWRVLGHEGVLAHLAWGHPPLPGLAEPAQAARALFKQHILADLSAPGISVFVTHDAIMLPALARTLPAVTDLSWCPRYLEAAALWPDANGYTLAFRNHTQTIQESPMPAQPPPDGLDLSPPLRALYNNARDAYISGDHVRALALDTQLHEQACVEAHALGKLLGKRFIGLCRYRLGDLASSEERLKEALRLAEEANDLSQELLITNHLAATVRRQGKLDEAYDLLTRALKRATLPSLKHEHARLLGNLGALFDEFGQRSRADDCYARFEVLTELLGNPHRLANARGLAARAAELRGDLDTAEEKYRQESELADEVGDPLRKIAATLHAARITARRGKADEAESLFKKSLDQTQNCTYEKRRIDALESYAEFLRDKRHDLPRAHYYLKRAAELSRDEPEKKAQVAHKLALVCRDAGLLGESLFYLMQSVETRHAMYKRLKLENVRNMANARLDELRDITDELAEEAHRVSRGGSEAKKLENLVVRVHGEGVWNEYEERLRSRPGPPLWQWCKDAEEAALETCLRRLSSHVFEALNQDTQKALVRAERAYGGAIDDLTRSAQLMALAVECELRERIFEPAMRHYKPPPKVQHESKTQQYFRKEQQTLGQMLESLGEVAAEPNNELSKGDFLRQFREILKEYMPLVTRIAILNRGITPLRGTSRRLLDIRNGAAHDLAMELDRLQIDAITRVLTLEIPDENQPTIMAALSQIRIA